MHVASHRDVPVQRKLHPDPVGHVSSHASAPEQTSVSAPASVS